MAPRRELEAPDEPLRAHVVDIRIRLGITGGQRPETYGPTSTLSEDLLLRGYGLPWPLGEEAD